MIKKGYFSFVKQRGKKNHKYSTLKMIIFSISQEEEADHRQLSSPKPGFLHEEGSLKNHSDAHAAAPVTLVKFNLYRKTTALLDCKVYKM